MRGIKSTILVTIMDFLYQGEANVSQDDLDSFLTVAEELKLRGLAGDSQSKEEQQKETHPKSKRSLSKREYGQHLSLNMNSQTMRSIIIMISKMTKRLPWLTPRLALNFTI